MGTPWLEASRPGVWWLTGDVFEQLARIPDNSIDLVMTSPPFLALRSYLPADHEHKAKEIGSEATPAAFIDTLLDVVEALAPKLTRTASLVFELGDTYSGSGGSGGDYNDGGFHEGQEVFTGSGLRNRGEKRREFGAEPPDRNARGPGWPLEKSLTLIPQSFAWALAYGRNPFNGRETDRWRIRNIAVWARPNPPVGALADKFRPATSYLTVATKARDRWFDMDSVRHEAIDQRVRTTNGAKNAEADPSEVQTANYDSRVPSNPAGAPLLDYWEIPTQPYVTPAGLVVVPSGETVHRVRVPVGAGADGIQRTTSPDCPLHGSSDRLGSSAVDGGHAGSESTRSGRNDGGPALARAGDSPPTPSRADQFGSSASPAGPAAIPRSKPSSRTARALATSPVGTPSAQKFADIADTPTSPESSAPDPGTAASSTALVGSDVGRLDTSFRTADNGKGASPCTCSYWVDVSVTSEPSRDYAELPDYWIIPTQPFRGAHYATFGEEIPRRVILSMCPQAVCRVCGEPRRRITEFSEEYAAHRARSSEAGTDMRERRDTEGHRVTGRGSERMDAEHLTTGWTDCGHGDYRPGVVLDPFCGSGTSLRMAFGNGRSGVGIDLDSRNVALARDRIGPLFFQELENGWQAEGPPDPILVTGADG